MTVNLNVTNDSGKVVYLQCGSGWFGESTPVIEVNTSDSDMNIYKFNIYSKANFHPLGACSWGLSENNLKYSKVAHFDFPATNVINNWDVIISNNGETVTYSGDTK